MNSRNISRVRPFSPQQAAGALLAIAILLGSVARGPVVVAQQNAADDLEVVQVRPNVYMLAGAGGNITVLIGPAGIVLVDSGTTAAAPRVLTALKRLTPLPIRYIINTSGDPDHTGANEILSRAGKTVFRAQGGTGNGVLDHDDIVNNFGWAQVLASEEVLGRMSAAKVPTALWPTKGYARQYPMYLNGEGIQVIHMPKAHTDGDSLIFFRRNDVIVAGDILDTTQFPMIDTVHGGTVQGEIDALNRIAEMTLPPFPFVWQEDRTLLIPGHGRVCDQHDLVEYRDMVTIERDIIQDMKVRGMTLAQVKAANPTKTYRARYGTDSGPWTTDMFVEAVYNTIGLKK